MLQIGIIHRVVLFPILNRMHWLAIHRGLLEKGSSGSTCPSCPIGRGQECSFHQMVFLQKVRSGNVDKTFMPLKYHKTFDFGKGYLTMHI